jgi:hypothetical protein
VNDAARVEEDEATSHVQRNLQAAQGEGGQRAPSVSSTQSKPILCRAPSMAAGPPQQCPLTFLPRRYHDTRPAVMLLARLPPSRYSAQGGGDQAVQVTQPTTSVPGERAGRASHAARKQPAIAVRRQAVARTCDQHGAVGSQAGSLQ